jgi:uncharacterized protein with WD repeat
LLLVAEFIEVESGKRERGSRMQAAIKDWEQDLQFLYMEYCAGNLENDVRLKLTDRKSPDET